MSDPHETMFNQPDPAWDYWSEKLSVEAQKFQDDETERKLKETDDLKLPPF